MLFISLGLNAQRPTVYLTEDFDASSSSLPDGWTRSGYTGSTSSYLWNANSNGRTGNCAYCAPYYSYTKDALFTPEVTLPAGKDCILSFWMKNSSSYPGNLCVYVSTDGGSTYTSNQLATGLDAGSNWTLFELSLSAYKGQSIKVVFLAETASGNNYAYYYIDDVTIQTAPTCQATVNGFVSGLTSTTVNVQWGLKGTGYGNVPDSFNIVVSAGGTVVSNNTYYMQYTGSLYSHQITGLTPNTAYTVSVNSNCLAEYAGTGGEAATVSFITPMTAQPLPYVENFDGLTTGLPAGSYGNNVSLNTATAYSYGGTGKSAKFQVSPNASAYLLFPPLAANADQIEMDFRVYTASNAHPTFYVGYATDPADVGSSFNPLLLDSVTQSGYWKSYRFNTAGVGDNTNPIMPCIMVNQGSSATVYFDDINVHNIPTCVRPENVVMTFYNESSATFTWNTTNAAQVRFLVKDANDSLVDTQMATASPYTVTGLTPQTTYRIYLQGVCSATDESDLTDPQVVTTRCGIVTTFPLTESFEDESYNVCWTPGYTQFTAAPDRASGSTYASTGTYSFRFPYKPMGKYSWLTSAPIQFTAGQQYSVSLNMYRGSSYEANTAEMVQIYVSTDPNDVTGATLLGSICQNYQNAPAEAAPGVYLYQYAVPQTVSGTQYVVIRYQSQNGTAAYIDDVTINEGTFCPVLRGTTGNLVENSVEIRLAETVAHWQVAYGPTGTDVANCTIIDTTNTAVCNIYGLTPVTAYDYYVRRICGAGDTSVWSDVRTFTTTEVPARAPYFCDFEDDAENAGWNFYNGTFSNTLVIGTSSAAVFSGQKALYVSNAGSYGYNVSSSASVYASRLINFGSGNYEINFKWKCPGGEGSFDYARVCLVPAGTDFLSTLTSYSSVVPNGIDLGGSGQYSDARYNLVTGPLNNGYNDFTTTLDMTGREGNWLLVIFWSDDTSAGQTQPFAIDDISISQNTCPGPQDVTVTMNNNDAAITWTAGGTETSWLVNAQLKVGSSVNYDTTFVATTTSAAVNGLTLPASSTVTVQARVRSLCDGGDTSRIVTGSTTFDTPCGTATSVSQGFESTQFPPACWTSGSTGTTPSRSTSEAHDGSASAFFNDQWGGNSSWIVSPPVDFGDSAAYSVNFWFRRTNDYSSYTSEGIQVYVSPTTDYTAGTQIGFVPRVYTATPAESYPDQFYYYEFTVPASYHGVNYVIFRYYNEYGAGSYVDDIEIVKLGSCVKVSPTVTGVDDVSATIEVPLTCTNWQLAYGTTGTPLDNMTIVDVTGANTYVLANLTSSTAYDFYVRQVCDSGEVADWSFVHNFTTLSSVAGLPYNCGFEDDAENAGWSFINTTTSGNNLYIGNGTARTGDKALYVRTGSSTTYSYNVNSSSATLAYRPINITGDNVQIEYKWKATGEGASYDFGRAFLVPATTQLSAGSTGSYSSSINPQGAIALDSIFNFRLNNGSTNRVTDANGWVTCSELYNMAGRQGTYNLVFYWMNDGSGGDQPPLAVDDIHIYEVTCVPPTTVVTTGVTPTAATLTYPQTGATAWEVIVDTATLDIDAGFPAQPIYRGIDSVGSVSLSNLTPNTDYYYVVRTICGAGDTSAWRRVNSFTTFCAPYNLPYNEGFEDAVAVNCWSAIDDGTGSSAGAITRSSSYRYRGNYSMRVNAAPAISPEFVVDSLSRHMITGYAYATSDSVSFGVGVITDPNDPSTYENFGNVLLPRSGEWQEFTAYFTGLDEEGYEDFRYAKHIVLAPGSEIVYFDDITVDLTPDCPKPTEPLITNVTSSSFDISFVDNANASAWTVTVVSGNDTLTYPITTNPATITGLASHMSYEVYIAAECGGTAGTSMQAYCGIVSTQCDELRLPYAQSFEDLSTSRIQDMETDMCWNSINAYDSSYPYFIATTDAKYVSDGSKALMLISSNSTPLYMVMPKFRSYPTIRMTYTVAMESSSSSGDLFIGYMTDANDASSFVAVDSVLKTQTSQAAFTTDFVALPASARIAFKYANATYSNYFCGIDNIRAVEVRNCPAPNDPQLLDVTYNSANAIFVDADATHSAWEWRLTDNLTADPDSLPQGTIVTTKDTIALANLTENTGYAFYVRTICGAGDTSAWAMTNFRTRCIPFHVTLNDTLYDDFEWTVFQENLTGCYDVTTSGSASYYVQGYANTRTNATPPVYNYYCRSGYRNVKVYTSNSTNPQGLTFYREVQLEAGKVYQASIYGLSVSYGASVTLGYNTVADIATATPIVNRVLEPYAPQAGTTSEGYSANIYYTGLQEITGFFSVPQDGTYFIGVNTRADVGDYYGDGYYDDFTVTELSGCLPVTNISVDSVTDETARLVINDTTATQFDYCVVNMTTGDTAVAVTTTSNSVVALTGLNAVTTYAVYVRSNCGAGSVSPWNNVVFTTECGVVRSFPFRESFEDAVPPTCWSQSQYGSATGNFARSSTYRHTGSYSAYKNDQSGRPKTALLTPELALTSPRGYKVALWVYRQSTYYQSYTDEGFTVYLTQEETLTDANLADQINLGFVATDYRNAPAEQNSGWYRYEYTVPAQCVGGNWRVAVEYFNRYGAGGYFDDLEVLVDTVCNTPAAPVINRFTSTTIDVATPLATTYGMLVGVAPGASATVADVTNVDTVHTANHIITGLTPDSVYRVFVAAICYPGDTSAWSAPATVTMRSNDCFEPQNLRIVGVVDDHSAAITWDGAPSALGYEYTLATGTTVVDSAVVTIDSVSFDTLTASTPYTFRVRTICQGDTSVWATLTFRTTAATNRMPFVCDFEDAAIRDTWQMGFVAGSTNGYVIGQAAAAVNAGNYSLYVSNDGSTYSYTTGTSAESYAYANVLIPAGTYTASYDWKCYGESSYDYAFVYLLPENGTISAYGAMPSGSISLCGTSYLNNHSSWTHYENTSVVVPTTGVYKLVVTWRDDSSAGTQPPFAIDNIFLGQISCPAPESIVVSSVLDVSATVTITKGTGNTAPLEWGYTEYGVIDSVTNWTIDSTAATTVTAQLTGLTQSTRYTVYARHLCSGNDTSIVKSTSFQTIVPLIRLPYVCDFETPALRDQWTIVTGNGEPNSLIMGTDVDGCNGGSYGLYVSNDSSTYDYDFNTSSTSYAYVSLLVPAGIQSISYDWRSYGESNCDYGRVYLLPENGTISASSLPSGAIALMDGSYLQSQSTWTTYTNPTLNITTPGVYKLVVTWKNDGSITNGVPLAVDNISFIPETCPAPVSVIATDVTETGATVTITRNSPNPIEWGYATGANMGDVTNWTIDTATTGNVVVNLTGLDSLTAYTVYARHICDTADFSRYVRHTFRTAGTTDGDLPFITGFEPYDDNSIWTFTSATNNHFMIGTGAAHTGTQALYITNDGTTRGYNNGSATYAYAYATLTLPAGGYTVSYDWTCVGESGYDYGRAFIVPGSTAIPNGTLMSGLGMGSLPAGAMGIDNGDRMNTNNGGANWNTEQYSVTINQAGEYKIVFFWRNDGSGGTDPLAIDNFNLMPNAVGGEIYDTICFNEPYMQHGLRQQAGRIQPGDTMFYTVSQASAIGVLDTTTIIHIHMYPENVQEFFDTACAGVPYTGHGFSIANPTTFSYEQYTTDEHGCNATTRLSLFTIPTTETRYDTICMGDAYTFGSQTLTGAGVFTDVITNSYGCPDTVTLHLAVVDTGSVTTATICEGDVYTFEGQPYTAAGTYVVNSVGARGCPVHRTLILTVLTTDVTIDTTICSGGQVVVADTVISSAGAYTRHVYNTQGCDVTYHINVTVSDPAEGIFYDDVCEGRTYNNFGFSITITADTVLVQTTKTIQLCDSITRVYVSFHPTQYGDTSVTIKQGETFTWDDNTYSIAGDYTGRFRDQFGCDSIVTLHLTVDDGDAVDNVTDDGSIRVVPNPVVKGQAALVFTTGVGEMARVEIINAYGAVVDSWEPHSTPIDLRAPQASGVYHVRVTTRDGRVYVEKLIVK